MDSLPPILQIVLVLLLLCISFLFAASENSLSNLNIYHYKVLADDGNKKAKLIVKMSSRFDDSLVTVLFGNNLSQVIISNIAAITFLKIGLKNNWPSGVESVVSTIVTTIFLYILIDFLPKVISKKYPNKMAEIIIYPLIIFYYLLFPIVFIFRLILKLIKKITHNEKDIKITKEEFIDTTIDVDSDVLEKNEKQIINKVFKIDNVDVNHILTKRENIYSLSIENLSNKELNNILLVTNFSRIPIYEGNKDNIIGILPIRTYFKELIDDKHLDARSVLLEPLKIKNTLKVDEIFKKLNNAKTHIAFVYDSKDNFLGMITMEDILGVLIDDIKTEAK